MIYIPDGLQMKEADQYTIQNLEIPSLILMENAARSCVEILKENKMDITHVCVVCGSGNNGGDGFAIARMLAEEQVKVTVILAGNRNKCTKETEYQIERFEENNLPILSDFENNDYSIIIDAIFGVGLSRNIEGHYKTIIDHMNQATGMKIAVDIPSGISADNGAILGTAFRADYTITFQAEKIGHLLYPGKEYSGEVIVKDIGISEKYFKEHTDVPIVYDQEEYHDMLPVRKADSHKGTYGKLLVIAGSNGMSGAAYLNAMSAYLTGAGLVQIYTDKVNRIILQQLLPEAIISTYEEYNENKVKELIAWADTVCIGSGLGRSDVSRQILKTVILESEAPCIIDADGLNILSEHLWYLDKKKHNKYIITPHMKEMSRLTGYSIGTIKKDRSRVINEFSCKYNLTCVLKDSRTIIKSPSERLVINTTGNSAMAKAGSGDVLAGIIAGLLVQTKECHKAASLGTFLHGKCGDVARKEKGSYSVMARDLMNNIPVVLKREER